MNNNIKFPLHPVVYLHFAARFARRCLISITALLLAVTAGAQAIIFTEDFESPTWTSGQRIISGSTNNPNGWDGSDNGSTILCQISSIVGAGGGGQSLYLLDNLNGGTPYAAKDLGSNVSQGYVQFDLMRPTGSTDYFYVNLGNAGNVWTANLTFAMSATALEIRATGMTTKTVTLASLGIALGEWNTFRLTFDQSAGTINFSLNGGDSIAGLSVVAATDGMSASAIQVGSLRLAAGYGGGFGVNHHGYIDNILVLDANATPVPEPATWAAIVGLLGLALTMCCRCRTNHRKSGWRWNVMRVGALLPGAFLFVATTGAVSAQAVVFSEDFEGPKWETGYELFSGVNHPGGWSGNHEGDITCKISAPVGGGTQCLFLQDKDQGGVPEAVQDLGSDITKGYVQFDLYRPVDASDNVYVYFLNTGDAWNQNFVLAVSKTAIRITGMKGARDRVATFAALGIREAQGKWHTYRVTFDGSARTMSVTVDGIDAPSLGVDGSDAAYKNISWQTGRIRLVAGYSASAAESVVGYFDNIQIADASK